MVDFFDCSAERPQVRTWGRQTSCSGPHLTSLHPCSYPLVKYLSEVLRCAVWVVVPANKLSLQEINQLIGHELLTSSFLENLVLSPNFQGGENARFDHPGDAHVLTYHKFKTVCLNSVQKRTHNSYSFFSHWHVQ